MTLCALRPGLSGLSMALPSVDTMQPPLRWQAEPSSEPVATYVLSHRKLHPTVPDIQLSCDLKLKISRFS